MSENFDQLKHTWLLADDSLLPSFEQVQNKITHLRKQKRKKVLLWYSAVISFSILIIAYVIYTDELNSLYKSISEFILLFTSIYLFHNSWKNITRQKREYLLSNVDFIKTVADTEAKRTRQQVFVSCTGASFFTLALFFHFLNNLLRSQISFLAGVLSLLAFTTILWVFVKPFYEKKIIKKNSRLLAQIKNFTNKSD